jgi:5-methylcytosine-specific restriction endonuclease McrA
MAYRTKRILKTTAKHKPLQNKVVDKDPRYNTRKFIGYSVATRKVNPRCNMCKGLFFFNELSLDHIIPVKEGGSFWDANNHQVLCRTCHSRKTMSELKGSTTAFKYNDDLEKIPSCTNTN